jgi:hypothetical protein
MHSTLEGCYMLGTILELGRHQERRRGRFVRALNDEDVQRRLHMCG